NRKIFPGQWNVCRFLLCEVIALDICSSYHLVAITINRYIAIVSQLRYHVYVTTRSTKYVIIFIWVMSQGVCVIMFTLYNPEEYILRQESSCRFELIFSLAHMCVYFIFQLILPLLFMIPMYARIANIARTQAKAIAILKRLPWHKDRACCFHINNHELKSTFMVSILLVSYTVAWVPFMTYSFYRIQCVQDCYFSPFIRYYMYYYYYPSTTYHYKSSCL
ncbi:melanocortin receptor 5-like, partial [Saccostrea cucullata]|uniref:melanocortin receptor 5-like n=1 Tax=Saccostrea cuccullata TaxID=36930 RepID=UPI002ED259A2